MDDVARLESLAQQLSARLRDDDPERVGSWLAAELPDPADWWRLCFVLAAAVPDTQRWSDLTAWCSGTRRLYHREYASRRDPEARRAYQREWKRRRREAAA